MAYFVSDGDSLFRDSASSAKVLYGSFEWDNELYDSGKFLDQRTDCRTLHKT
jgi:hypothetical protein